MNSPENPSNPKRQGRIFYGWIVVAVASVQGMFGNGTISSGFPIFFLPIQRDLGIGYASMSLVFSLGRAEGGMGGPLVGYLDARSVCKHGLVVMRRVIRFGDRARFDITHSYEAGSGSL